MSRNTIDTRDLYKRQQELEDLKDAVENAKEELKAAEEALELHPSEAPDGATEEETEAHDEKTKELEEAVSDAQTALDDAQAEFGTDEQEELEELDGLENEISEWRHGQPMIPEDEFEDYAREFAEEIGAIPDDAKWPATCIDWEQAAKELAMDYTTVSYQGSDYYVRS